MSPGGGVADRIRWCPALDLLSVHDADFATGMWQGLLAAVDDPVRVSYDEGQRIVQVLGVARFRRAAAGPISVELRLDRGGEMAWVGVAARDIVVHGIPAGWYWLDIVRCAAAHEIEADSISRTGGCDPAAIDCYCEALFAHLRRRLARQADLRLMRRRVAQALQLDADALRLARRLIQIPTDWGLARMSYYNAALRHLQSLRVLERELPAAVPLYAAVADRDDFPRQAQPACALRAFLLAQGLEPRSWRLLARAGQRLWLPIRQFYRGDAGEAMLDYLRLLQRLDIGCEPPAWLAWCLLAQAANPENRHPAQLQAIEPYLASIGHAARAYLSLPQRDASRVELALIANWISAARPEFDKMQRRAGWSWLVRSAARWEQSRVDAAPSRRWPVPLHRHVAGATVCELLDSALALQLEAQAMHHCIADFAGECERGDAVVASIREASRPDGRVATALLRRSEDRWRVEQVRGVANVDPDRRAVHAAQELAAAINSLRWQLVEVEADGDADAASAVDPAYSNDRSS